MAFLQWRTVQEMGCVNSIWLQERLKKQVSLSLNLVSRFFFICLVAEKKRKEKKRKLKNWKESDGKFEFF